MILGIKIVSFLFILYCFRERITQIQGIWSELTMMLKERDSKLEEAGDLHRFLRDLDHFQVNTQSMEPLNFKYTRV
jgi:hypothetical protein